MRVITLLCIVAVTLACGSSMPLPQSPAEDAGTDATPDASNPFPTDLCDVHDFAVTHQVLDCNTGLCAGRSLVVGESCSDLPVDTLCEKGDHPDLACNELVRCNAQHQWQRDHAARSAGACSRTVKAGPGCRPNECSALKDVPCQQPGQPDKVCSSWDGDCVDVGADRPRLSCPCSIPSKVCGFGCFDGVMKFVDCPGPPG
ncbi:hypothetical protein BH09MYX1_BH09MYX1_09560 [soil metagenome]